MKHFLAISTGQNVANVLPILEAWEAGDRVIWLESDLARAQGWSVGALDVLAGRGIGGGLVERLPFGEHPRELLRALRPRLREMDASRPVVWVGNGGTKPQALAVEQALAGWGGRSIYVYNANRKVGYEAFPQGLEGDPTFLAYRGRPLGLADLLRISGYGFFGGERPVRLWPGPPPPPAADGFGHDPETTFEDCEQRFRWRRIKQEEADPDRLPLLRMPYLRERDPQGFQEWRDRFLPQLKGICNQVGGGRLRATHFDMIFNSVIGFAERAYRKERQAAWQKRAAPPKGSGGERFEQAVARRLYDWIEAPEQAPVRSILSGVWANVRIARRGVPDRLVQELDIALLLRNGVLLAVECKAGQFDSKDLDARLLNMQASASLESSMAIAVPAYTGYVGRLGATDMIRRWKRLQELPRFRALPFTLPGQPPSWQDPDTLETLPVPTFEDALGAWLRPYLP